MRLLLCLVFSLPLVCGCASESATNTTGTNNADAAAAEDSKMLIIDVRSQEEWDDGHLENAIHIPHTEIGERIAEHTDDKSARIVLHCKMGGRAGKAKETLEELGFTNVENGGGIDDMRSRFE